MSTLISIVIPTYNHAEFLSKALASVIGQSYPHWEAVVVDNHSNDNTVEVVNSFNDPRIKLLQINNDGVIAVSRNLGIKESTGQWIAFLDSDDIWYPEKLETIIKEIEPNDSFDVICNDELMVDINSGHKKVSRCGPYEDNFYRGLLIGGNRLSPSATVVRRKFLMSNNILFNISKDYITVEDYDFWLHLARKNARFKFIQKVMGEYTIHNSNNSYRLKLHWDNNERLLRDHIYNIQDFDANPSRLWSMVHPRIRLMKARQLFANKDIVSALRVVLLSLLGSPLGTAAYVLSKITQKIGAKNAQ